MYAKRSRATHLGNILILSFLVIEIFSLLGSCGSDDSQSYDNISITVPPLASSWNLDPLNPNNIQQGNLILNSTQPWSVAVFADTRDNDGCLAEFNHNNSDYVSGGSKLSSSMKISGPGRSHLDLSQEGILVSGDGNEGEISLPFTLKQDVTLHDRPLHNGNVYHMAVNFVVTPRIGEPPCIDLLTETPSSGRVDLGAAAIINVVSSGSRPFTYQWYKLNESYYDGGFNFAKSMLLANGGHISGANTDTLKISDFDGSDVGYYAVIVSNLWGSNSRHTIMETSEPEIIGPDIGWSLSDDPDTNKDTASFSVIVDPPGDYSYQWQRSNDLESDIWTDITNDPTATTSTLSFHPSQADGEYEYRVAVSKGGCSWPSYSARLFVGLKGPEDCSVLGWGDQAYFYIERPWDTDKFDFQWQVKNGSGNWKDIDLAENPKAKDCYFTFITSPADSTNVYRVKITNKNTGYIKTSKEVVVHNGITGPDDYAAGLKCGSGTNAGFSVKPNSDFQGYIFWWEYSSDNGSIWHQIANSGRSSIYPWVTLANDGWMYRAHVQKPGGIGGYSRNATLTVYNAACINAEPSSKIVCPGGTATFSVGAAGGSTTDQLAYQWHKVSSQGNDVLLSNAGHISGANTPTLTISSADSSDAAYYYVNVTEPEHGSMETSEEARLGIGFPFIRPLDKTVAEGGSVLFSVDPLYGEYIWDYDYQWQESADGGSSWNNIDGQTNYNLRITNTTGKNGYMYRVKVGSGDSPCSISKPATLTVLSHPKLNISLEDDPDPVRPDEDLNYVIRYLNGGAQANNAVVDFQYDNRVQFVSTDESSYSNDPVNHHFRLAVGTLPSYAGSEHPLVGTILITVHVDKSVTGGSSLLSTATISCDNGDSNSTSAKTDVDSSAPMLRIEKAASNGVLMPGDSLEYLITYQNRGSITLHNVTINDSIDKHLVFDSASSAPTRTITDSSGTHLWWSANDLGSQTMPPGSSRVLALSVHLPFKQTDSSFDRVYNNYNISSNEVIGNFNTLQTFIVHSLWIRKTAEKQLYSPGEVVNYTISYGSVDDPRDAINVSITDVLPGNMEYLAAEPSPTMANGNILVWNIGTIHNNGKGTISLYAKVTENVSEMTYKSSGYVSGEGFANVHQNLNAAQKPDHLTNFANISGYYQDPNDPSKFDHEIKNTSATIRLADSTEVSIKGHGSGSYSREENAELIQKNRSIEVKTSLSENYHPTSFSLPDGRSINYASKWSEAQKSKNHITGASLSEVYMYANKIKRDSSLHVDKNGSTVISQTSFVGAGHIGVLKRSDTGDTSISKQVPTYESRDDYLGNFSVYAYADEYGRNVASNRSVSGTGFASADKRLGRSQRSYESGTGSYQVEEQAQTQTSYMAKDINVSYGPMSYSYTPDVNVSLSKKWDEGIWSKSGTYSPKDSNVSGPSSVISEQFSNADYLKKKTVASGLSDMKTEAEFSGTAQFKVVKKEPVANGSNNEVALYDEYIGRYKLSRHVQIGVARFNEPHLSISKVGKTEPDGGSLIDYTIKVVNDGSTALGPIYVTDIFPQDTKYVYSSLRPSLLTPKSANWTLVSLGIGQSSIIDLRLKAIDDTNGLTNMDNIVNMVCATGGYNNRWITACNISILKPTWLSCCPEQIFAEKTAYIDRQDPMLIHYNITLKNRANYTMGASIIDQLPDGMIFVNSSFIPSNLTPETIYWDIIDIKAGETETINYAARALKSGIFVNQAHVAAYPADGTEPVSTDMQSYVEVKGEDHMTPSSSWQPPSSFGLNYTQQGTDGEWIPCESCLASASASEIQPSGDQSCPVCGGSGTDDDGYDLP